MFEIYCSSCGNCEKMNRNVQSVKSKTEKGWRSFGDAIYCPKCAKTWKERNNTELNTTEETNEWIYERLLNK